MIANVGEMRQLVTLQRAIKTVGPTGGKVDSWVSGNSYVARIESLSGRELFNAMQIKNTISHKISMRNEGQGIIPSMRLLYGSRVFNIEVVMDETELGYYLTLMCTELTNQ
jgi:SPP1 family predicted phage head-tail adaptor